MFKENEFCWFKKSRIIFNQIRIRGKLMKDSMVDNCTNVFFLRFFTAHIYLFMG